MPEGIENSIDRELFGMLVRRNRLNLGYRKAEEFVKIMEKVTGYALSRDGLYRIETGKSTPTIDFIIAFNIMMGKPAFDSTLLDMCLPNEWRNMSEAGQRQTRSLHEYDFDDAIPF